MDTPTTPTTNLSSVRTSRFSTPTKTSNSKQEQTPHHPKKRLYCTQQFLLSLVNGSPLDPHCPNTDLHRHPTPASDQHPVESTTQPGATCSPRNSRTTPPPA